MTIGQRRLAVTFAATLAGIVLLGSSCKLANKAPSVPTVSGPTTGVAGVALTFTATATDPEADSVAVMFDWGDGATPAWTTLVASGDTITATNTYADSGTFTIKARAKDKAGKESDWSAGQTLSLMAAGPARPDSILAKFHVSLGCEPFAVTPDGRYAYCGGIRLPDHDTVTPLSLPNGTALPRFRVFEGLHNFAISPDGTRLCANRGATGRFAMIRIPDNVIEDSLVAGHNMQGIAFSTDSRYVYACAQSPQGLLVLDAATCTLVDTIDLYSRPTFVLPDPAGDLLYLSLTDAIGVLQISTKTLIDTVTSIDPGHLALSPDGSKLYAGSWNDTGFVVIRTSDMTVLQRIRLDTAPADLTTTADGAYLVVTTGLGVSFIDTRTYETVGSLPIATWGLLVMRPNSDTLYVSDYSDVYLLGPHR